MISFGTAQTQMQDLASDTTSATLTFLKRNYNIGYRTVMAALNRHLVEKEGSVTTVASQQEYEFHVDYVRVKSITVTVSSTAYPVTEVEDQLLWDQLNASTAVTSDYPSHFFAKDTTFELYPKPTSAGNTITVVYEATRRDLTAADYTTGTITTLANGAKAVTGSGTTWTAAMVGRYLQITSEGNWYETATRTGNTAITLTKNYEGTSISSGSEAYTIGEMPALPGDLHELPIFYALAQYYGGPRRDRVQEQKYLGMFNGSDQKESPFYYLGLRAAQRRYGTRSSTGVIQGKSRIRHRAFIFNPNDYPTSLS